MLSNCRDGGDETDCWDVECQYWQLKCQVGAWCTTCFDFCLLSPPRRTPEFVCIGLMSVMEGMTAAMALTNATVLAKKGFAQV